MDAADRRTSAGQDPSEKQPKKLTCFVKPGAPMLIRPAVVDRDWMDATPDRFAYRCLPLNIANTHGWELLNPTAFETAWTGAPGKDAIGFRPLENGPVSAISHFGQGVLTFHVHGLFQTPPGYNLMVMGSPNRLKAGIQPLVGVIETDWSPYSFTMNWRFTLPNFVVRFDRGEPFAFIFPVKRDLMDEFTAEIRAFSDAPDLEAQHDEWAAARNAFNDSLKDPESEATQEKWQKAYYKGLRPDGSEGVPDHKTRVRACPFTPPPQNPAAPKNPDAPKNPAEGNAAEQKATEQKATEQKD
jgi:hypothetical protein